MLREDKLYVVTHANLSVGYQAAQIAHAVADFTQQHSVETQQWHNRSNSVIILEAHNVEELYGFIEKAENKGITYTYFREPDLGDEITAIAFAPGKETVKMLSNLPCLGRKLQNQSELKNNEHKLRELSFAMMDHQSTEQCNLLQHNRNIKLHYEALIQHVQGKINLSEQEHFFLPEWFTKDTLNMLPSPFIMDRLITMRNCGQAVNKPTFEAFLKANTYDSRDGVLQLMKEESNPSDEYLIPVLFVLLAEYAYLNRLNNNKLPVSKELQQFLNRSQSFMQVA